MDSNFLHIDRAFLFKGVPLYYSRQGKGMAVVFLHGFMESREIWNDFISFLPKDFHYISIDLPGHGKSGCLSYVHTMEDMAESVHFVLKKLRIRKSVFIGHSMGGYVALAYAEMYPDSVLGLCLFHSSARADTIPKKQEREKAINIVKQNFRRFVHETIPRLFYITPAKPQQKLIKRSLNIALQTPLQGAIAALEGMKIRSERELIIRFAPYRVAFIIGKNDAVLPYETILEQAKLPENCDCLLIENCGHMGFMEQPEACAAFLRKWLRKIENSPH